MIDNPYKFTDPEGLKLRIALEGEAELKALVERSFGVHLDLDESGYVVGWKGVSSKLQEEQARLAEVVDPNTEEITLMFDPKAGSHEGGAYKNRVVRIDPGEPGHYYHKVSSDSYEYEKCVDMFCVFKKTMRSVPPSRKERFTKEGIVQHEVGSHAFDCVTNAYPGACEGTKDAVDKLDRSSAEATAVRRTNRWRERVGRSPLRNEVYDAPPAKTPGEFIQPSEE